MIGLIAGSLSIIMDALNNLSNALSSIITIANMFYNKYGVILTIGIYASNIDNDEYLKN